MTRHLPSGLPRLLAGALAGLTLAACGDSGTAPGGDGLRLEVVSGDAQAGLAGEVLPAPVTVRVAESGGTGRSGVQVRFEVRSGGGSVDTEVVTSDVTGLASAKWRLGPPSSPQALRATLATGGGEEPLEITATALATDQADVLVVHGATAPLRGVLVVEDGPSSLQLLQTRAVTDTVVLLQPISGGAAEVLVFSRAERPLRAAGAWTADPDTLHVTLEPAVAVDMVFDIRAGQPAQQEAVMRLQLEATERIWTEEGMGLRVGEITFEDRTAEGGVANVSSTGLCSGLVPQTAIRITLVGSIDNGRYDGWGCWSGHIFLSLGTFRHPNLLAHELGHTFTLEHTVTGMMYPNSPGTDVRDGEVFRAHFHQSSALNTIFESQPPTTHRFCVYLAQVSPCLPDDFELPGSRVAQLVAPAAAGAPVDGVGR